VIEVQCSSVDMYQTDLEMLSTEVLRSTVSSTSCSGQWKK